MILSNRGVGGGVNDSADRKKNMIGISTFAEE